MQKLVMLASILCTSLFLLGGCSSTGDAALSPRHPNDAFDDNRYNKLVEADMLLVSKWEREDYYGTNDQNERKDIRNRIIDTTRKHTDEYWRRFRSSFYGRIGLARSATEITSGVLSAAAAVTTPLSAAKILSALSTTTLAAGTSLEKNILQETAADVLLAQMELDRDRIGRWIDQSVKDSVESYPLSQALADLGAYARALSVPSALTSLRSTVGSEQKLLKDAMYPLSPGKK